MKILHTADWHIGKRYPSFDEGDAVKLKHARLAVVSEILDTGKRNQVQAILCAGDLFDEPDPSQDYWEGFAKQFSGRVGPQIPVFLLPGNHDPLLENSVWSPKHPLRSRLPDWVHVVDRDDFSYEFGTEAVLYARPCRSKAGQDDPALLLPAREPGDERLRIGMVHGNTMEIKGYQSNFPISHEASRLRGLDYLAIGDHHSFRNVTPKSVPTVYPGAPEPTSFDEPGAGNVVLVNLYRHGYRHHVAPLRVAKWKWEEKVCKDLDELRQIYATPNLTQHVLRLRLQMGVSIAEESELERILRELKGTEALPGRAGILIVDRADLRLIASSTSFQVELLPPVLQDVVKRLDELADSSDSGQRDRAIRAQSHLYKMLQNQGGQA